MTERSLLQRWERVRRFTADRGLGALAGLAWQRIVGRSLPTHFERAAVPKLRAFSEAAGGAPTYIIWSTLDWKYPFRQRPHHLASALVDRGHRVVFVTPSHGADHVMSAERLSPRLMLTPFPRAALHSVQRPVLMLLSTDTRWQAEDLELAYARGGVVVYDYLDALDDSLSVSAITTERRALHARLLSDDDRVAVLSVADVLGKEVSSKRSKAHAVVTNGVDLDPFAAARRDLRGLRQDFAAIVARNRPIIGYYGSLAAWFDYDLMLALARARPNFEIVTIGPDLDGSSEAFADKPANLHALKGMDYNDLPRHGVWFDVSLVPFLINDITIATSPLKVFEYMAMRSPIVSTPMPECQKYQSILIGHDQAHFIAQIDVAMNLRGDADYEALLLREARANTWSAKAEQIEALVAALLRNERKSAARRAPRTVS